MCILVATPLTLWLRPYKLNDSHPPLSNNWGQEVAFYFCLLFTRTLVLARVINPRRMRCRVTVVVLYVCVSICYQASCYIPYL